ncbi:MAG: acyltransferase domain-containing protein, partial [Bryobacteraceae bacterium]
HSMGEIAAAHVAGGLSFKDAVLLTCQRSRVLRNLEGHGAMALVELSIEEAREATRGREKRLGIAAHNGPRSTVLSGDESAIEEVLAELERQKIFHRRIKAGGAGHSPQVDALLPEFSQLIMGLTASRERVPFYSTVTGERNEGLLSAGYWKRNVRETVQFWPAVEGAWQDGYNTFLEIGPHPMLLHTLDEGLRPRCPALVTVPSITRKSGGSERMLTTLGTIHAAGYDVDWRRIYPKGRVVPLPAYPWQRKRYWIEARGGRRRVGHPLLGQSIQLSKQPGTRVWQTTVDLEALPYLADHQADGTILMPAAAYLEMGLAAMREAYPESGYVLENVAFHALLPLTAEISRTIQVVLTPDGGNRAALEIAGWEDETGQWNRHASLELRLDAHQPALATDTPDQVRARCRTAVPGLGYYSELLYLGAEYGPALQGIERLWKGRGEALARIGLPGGHENTAYLVHPALMDACLQVLFAALPSGSLTVPALPVSIRHLRVYRQPPPQVWSHARTTLTSEGFAGDVRVFDENGELLVEILGIRARRMQRTEDAR